MWKPETMELMPGFWPPKPSRLWNVALEPLRRHYLHRFYNISRVTVTGTEHLSTIRPTDGVLLAPNHSHDSDPHVMMDVGKRLGRQLYFMAAWQVFLPHKGIDGFVMQRMGAFSVDREGCDRRAIRQATELLTTGQWLVVFPEGEIFHTNERLTPLKEGVAFMTVTSQTDLAKSSGGGGSGGDRAVWVVPTAIRYTYHVDVTPKLEASVAAMEQRFVISGAGKSLPERIVRLGEVLLTIKEKEKLGDVAPASTPLPQRLERMIDVLLERLETKHLHKVTTETVPVRVKTLRRHLIEQMCDDKCDDAARRTAHNDLGDLHLVLQLYSYPGDYVTAKPTVERMAETIEKFEEDLGDGALIAPKGPRSAAVRIGQPIDVRPFLALRSRAATGELTAKLEEAIKSLMADAATAPATPA
jgi:1-acyl-sn-glycerol-3-phosphate acyltransferase